MINKLINMILATTALIILAVSQAQSTTVDVYAEAGYSDTKVIVNIYADIEPSDLGTLASAGVKLVYPINKLQNPAASKNEKEWYFGAIWNMYAYGDPDMETTGEVIFLVGKLDLDKPQEGVHGLRIPLGSVLFDRISATEIPVQADFSLSAGKAAPFTDFATVNGNELDDSVNFAITPIVTQATLNIRGVIRILRVVSNMSTDVPVRATEMDTDSDGVVGIPEAIALMAETAQ